jgi:hypothetical protein
MKALFGAVVGVILSGIGFLANYFDQLLAIGRGSAGLLVAIQLNNAINIYLFGGAILGAIIGLSFNSKQAVREMPRCDPT